MLRPQTALSNRARSSLTTRSVARSRSLFLGARSTATKVGMTKIQSSTNAHKRVQRLTSHLTAAKTEEEPFTLQIEGDNVILGKDTNQALGLGHYAIEFMAGRLGKGPSPSVLHKTEQFHTDSVFCGLSALSMGCRSPHVLRAEALEYPEEKGATVFGSTQRVKPEKAVLANANAVREWDSNGTVFGYNPNIKGHTAGEFGHNDFYPVVVAACQVMGYDGKTALMGMLLVDEIRGRLSEVFSLKTYKIDHVVHGAIASAAVYGAIRGATPKQIESAIGIVCAHYIPFRAIRAGKQLSDSKGASAGISAEVAVIAMERAMRGFLGPQDIFRNPEAIFRIFEPTHADGESRWVEKAPSPFNLVLAHSGEDFSVMGMHFKLGLYEHQSAGAIQGVLDLVGKAPQLVSEASGDNIQQITIVAYEPAFGIIGNPAKMNPTTRQSADHSMAFIISQVLKRAIEHYSKHGSIPKENDERWKAFMLSCFDYKEDESALYNPITRSLMSKISFKHGGEEYDKRYPDGIPTSLVITDKQGAEHDSGLVMYPGGHARNTVINLQDILDHKNRMWGEMAVEDVEGALKTLGGLSSKSADEIQSLYSVPYKTVGGFD